MGLRRILEPGETIVLRLPTSAERRRSAILWGVGFPVLAATLRYLSGFRPATETDIWRNAGAYAAAALLAMLASYWLRRPRIIVTDRRFLVRRGMFWGRHEQMPVRDVAGMDYDLKSRTLSLYGNRRVLAVSCDELAQARIIVALAGPA